MRAWKGGVKMEIRENGFEENAVRVGVDTVKGFCESAGLLPPPSPAEWARRFAEGIALIVQSVQRLK